MESKCGNLLQIFQIEKAFGIWKAWISCLKKCLTATMGMCGTGFFWCHKAKCGWISHNCVSSELDVVESGFIAQIKWKNWYFQRLWDIESQKIVIVDKLAIFDPTDALCIPQVRSQLSGKILIVKRSFWWRYSISTN